MNTEKEAQLNITYIQLTPDNSNLQGNWKKKTFELSGVRATMSKISKKMTWKENESVSGRFKLSRFEPEKGFYNVCHGNVGSRFDLK